MNAPLRGLDADTAVSLPAGEFGSAETPQWDGHLLQKFLFPSSPDDETLFLRKLGGELFYGDTLATHDNAHISFNSYFNSFYEDHWVRHTPLTEVRLEISGKGEFWCNVFRDTSSFGCKLVARVLIRLTKTGTRLVAVPIPLKPRSEGYAGRLFVDLEMLEASHISAMSWTTAQAPQRDVALGVGICSFKREPFLVRTVARVLDADPEAAVAQVVVVNQGPPFTSSAFEDLVETGGSRLRIVEQGNFGGAGGFTRSAMELMKNSDVTHVLFMDDDIQLDATHLVTTAAFLRYAQEPVVLGGHMLDLFQRHILYEAGNVISPENLLRPNHHNLDLRELSTLTALSRAIPAHFNGWWYAAIPVQCFHDLGLPVPIFIRGDDLEYGARLHRAGIQTVSLPPVSVWHEPFYAKAPGWQLYYDLRNRLIFASFYDDAVRLDSPKQLFKRLMCDLIRYDYQQASFMMQALDDYLKGPPLLDEGLPAIHERITKEGAKVAPVNQKSPLGLHPAPSDVPDSPMKIRRRMWGSFIGGLLGRTAGTPLGILWSGEPLHWMRLGPSYVLSDREGHFFLRYTYSRRLTWRYLRLTGGAILRYARQRKSAAQAWKAAQKRLVSEESWLSRLGLDAAEAPHEAQPL